MILVYHAKEMTAFPAVEDVLESFDLGIDPAANDAYSHVASVELDDMEEVYARTNHLYGNWCDELIRDELGLVKGNGKHRSTSVGDVFVCQDGIYLVDRVGFTLARRFDISAVETLTGLKV